MKQINTSMPFCGYIDSRQGGRPENQDSCGFADTALGLLIVVCDGMGGGPGGKTASALAVEMIIREIQKKPAVGSPEEVLSQVIKMTNALIYKKGLESASLRGMGSTVVALLLNKQSALVAHVGDSRMYQFRRSAKVFRTFDHSMVFDLVRQKVITEEQARLSAQSNLITRALGVKSDVEVEIHELSYEKGDRFLLCTDGLCGAMPERELIRIVTNRKTLEGILEHVIIKIDEQGCQQGGEHDNLTGVLIEAKFNSKRKEKMSTRIRNIVWGVTALCCISIACNIIQFTRLPLDSKEFVFANGIDSIPNMQKAEMDKLRQEMNELKQSNQKSLDSISDLLSRKKTDIAQLYIKDKNDKQIIIDKLDEIIERLAQVRDMPKGEAKKKAIKQVVDSIEKLAPPLQEKYGLEKQKIYDNSKGIIGYLNQDIAQESGGNSIGHYNAIIKEMKSVKEKVGKFN